VRDEQNGEKAQSELPLSVGKNFSDGGTNSDCPTQKRFQALSARQLIETTKTKKGTSV
jgi:hypothetical protein